jgi:hypothetical protein
MSNCKTSAPNLTSVERDPVFLSQKGKPGGVATLDASGKIPLAQINIAAVFTERDPVYLADRGQPFGVPTLDGMTLVPREQLGTGTPDGTKVLWGDATWRVPPSGGGSGGPDVDLDEHDIERISAMMDLG